MNLKPLLIGITFIALSACSGSDKATTKSGASLDTPHGTILANVDAMRRSDFGALLKANLTDAQLTEMKTEWEKQRQEEPTESEKAEFAQSMAMLTAEGAEDNLMAMVEPQLAQMKTQMPFFVMMAQTYGGQAIEANTDMSDGERETATKMLTAVADWANKADLANPELARKAIGVAAETARGLDLDTLEDVQALDFDELLEKGGAAFGGTKEVLSVYGISMDDLFDSMEAKTTATDGDNAVVDLSFEFLGVAHSVPVEMVKVDGRWTSANAAKAMEEIAAGEE
ncbi:MAG: hypothetical protein AAF438_01340 [Pseudomonadota bacterium]